MSNDTLDWRKGKSNPVLAFIGPSGCGKDSAGIWLGGNTDLRFQGGCSYAARAYIAGILGISPDEAYESRHTCREIWLHKLRELRRDDPTKLVRAVLETSDLVCGIRDMIELQASKEAGLLDLVLWVDNPRVPLDPTLNIGPLDCDISISNNGTLQEFHNRLLRLVKAMGLCIRQNTVVEKP